MTPDRIDFMSDESVLYQPERGTARITLNRPDKLNSFDDGMFARLAGHLATAEADPAVRAILITGAGRGFCAGQDIAGGVPQGAYGVHVERTWNPIVRAIREIEKPVVAAVNGVAAGAGANLALACDFVIAAEEAAFIQSFVNIGLVPDTGGSFLLPKLVGRAQATAMLMLGDKLPAARAYELGMIYQVVPLASLLDTATTLAARLSAMPTRALGLTKRLLNAAAVNGLTEQLTAEADAQTVAGASRDHAEGVAAFRDKRKPVFVGQ